MTFRKYSAEKYKTSTGSKTIETVLVYWDQWDTPYQAIWQHELRDSIETHMFPEGQRALIPVLDEGRLVVRAIPMEFAEVLARRFGKRIEAPTRPADGGPPTPASASERGNSTGCASTLCLFLACIAVLGDC